MHFAFADEQLELRDAVRQLLAGECRPADVRAFYDVAGSGPDAGSPTAGATPDRRRWKALAEMGAPGLLVPGARGGLGLSEIDLVAVAEEAGRVALPEPIGVSAGVAVPILAGALDAPGEDTGAIARLEKVLGEIGTGAAIAAVGGVRATPTGEAVTTESGPSGLLLTPDVTAAEWADFFVLVAEDQGDRELHLVPADALARTSVATLDPTRTTATVQWSPGPATRIATGEAAQRLTAEIVERDALVRSAELLGLTAAMIDLTAAYAIERKQFGRAIGSFQAVKHHLADARVRLEFAKPAVYRAAWAFGRSPQARAHDCSMALAMAADAATLAARVGLQVHGAIGYTWECDLQLWLKRTWALTELGQTAPLHRARVLRQALGALHEHEGPVRGT